jgi:hypothetical protein
VPPVLGAKLSSHLHDVDDMGVVPTLNHPDLKVDAVAIRAHVQGHAAAHLVRPDVVLEDLERTLAADSMPGCSVGEADGHLLIIEIMCHTIPTFKVLQR